MVDLPIHFVTCKRLGPTPEAVLMWKLHAKVYAKIAQVQLFLLQA